MENGPIAGIMNDKKSSDDLQRQIDENLKRVYADQVEDTLPDRFTDLLAKLRAGDAPEASGGQESDK